MPNERPVNRLLVLAAHPDDETIGCAGLIGRTRDAFVAHLTDGAPRDPRFVPSAFRADRAAYRLARRAEVEEALAMAGVTKECIACSGVADQDATFELTSLVRWLVDLCARVRPDTLVAHSYEGGHPDHDAAAFVAHAAVTLAA